MQILLQHEWNKALPKRIRKGRKHIDICSTDKDVLHGAVASMNPTQAGACLLLPHCRAYTADRLAKFLAQKEDLCPFVAPKMGQVSAFEACGSFCAFEFARA